MKIGILCPAPPRSLKGNRVTAERWAKLLRRLGHQVKIAEAWRDDPWDVLIALHALKSHDAAGAWHEANPRKPLVVALSGTDLYRDFRRNRTKPKVLQTLQWADRIVALQPMAASELPPALAAKTQVIWQSATHTPRVKREARVFTASVLGHLRAEKDPLRAATALRYLPGMESLRIVHAGRPLDARYQVQAEKWMRRDSRYCWLGELTRDKARKLLASSDVLIVSSIMEGGANVVSEALVDAVPVIASDVPGNIGMLGEGYPGYFPVGDTRGLAEVLRRTIEDTSFYQSLKRSCARLAPRFTPAAEQESWRRLLSELPQSSR